MTNDEQFMLLRQQQHEAELASQNRHHQRTLTIAQMAKDIFLSRMFAAMQVQRSSTLRALNATDAVNMATEIMVTAEASAAKEKELQEALSK